MAFIYFDSSALVKLVVDLVGSDLAAELWDGCDAALSSRLAYPEVRAALAAADLLEALLAGLPLVDGAGGLLRNGVGEGLAGHEQHGRHERAIRK